jgi:SAM-dependent methyltransferase
VAGCRAAYDAHAAEYARQLDPTLADIVERLVQLADARRGTRLLDLATGTGALARVASDRGASVVGVDVSAPMLAIARERSPEAEFCLADAHALPFSDGEFDVVVCALALSHFHEPLRALGEVLRVLREDGRLVASTWAGGFAVPALARVVDLLERRAAGDKGYALDEQTWFYPEQGSAVLHRAGFASVAVITEEFTGCFADAEQALRWTLTWPRASARLARLDKPEAFVDEARHALGGADLSWNFVFNVYLATKATGR